MAWKDACELEAKAQYDKKKVDGLKSNEAFRLLSGESGIPIGTLKRWIYGIRPKPIKRIKNDPVYETCAISNLEKLIDSGKKFGTIYADPPWQYSNQGTRSATDNHYSTMTVEEICNLPIHKLAADECHLHLWTTNAFIFEAKSVLESWGFHYKSIFVWVKPQMGIGNYWRVSHEFLITAITIGAPTFYNNSQMSWEELDRTRHSKKPEEIAKKIELVSPGPYLELFGRQARKNWVVWGNEIKLDDFNLTWERDAVENGKRI